MNGYKIIFLVLVLCSLGSIGIAQQVSTFAGTGTAGYSGDNALALSAEINRPYGIVTDENGNIFFTDQLNYAIRRIDKSTNVITTVISQDHTGAAIRPNELTIDGDFIYFINNNITPNHILKFSVDDNSVSFVGEVTNTYVGICVKGDSIFLANPTEHVIDVFNMVTGTLNTFTGVSGSSGNVDGSITSALFSGPYSLIIDNDGNLIIGELGGGSIRKIDLSTDQVTTLATGFNLIEGIAVSNNDEVYIAEKGNHQVKKISSTGSVVLVAGNGTADFVNGESNVAAFNKPVKIAIDNDNNIYVSDLENHRIRLISCETAERPTLKISSNSTDFCIDSSNDLYIYVDSDNSELNENEYWTWYSSSCDGEELATSDTLYVNPTETTSYFVRGEGGCFQNGECEQVTLSLVGCDTLTTIQDYTAFSPNNDGVNDEWIIDGIESYSQNKVYIYNRWGDLISKIDNYNNVDKVWKGISSSYEAVAAGTYFYIIEDGNNKKLKSGWVQVIR